MARTPSHTHTHTTLVALILCTCAGSYALATYTLCVNVSSRWRNTTVAITAAITTDLTGAGAHITGYFVNNGTLLQGATASIDTVVAAKMSFIGLEFNTGNGPLTATYR